MKHRKRRSKKLSRTASDSIGAKDPEHSSSTSLEISESLLKSSTSEGSGGNLTNSSGISSTDSNRPLVRPPISYAMLITEAIQQSPDKQLILSDIYEYVKEHYPYFKFAGSGWKNSVRHNLSLNRAFCKVPRPQKAGGKGSYWKLADSVNGKRRNESEDIFRRQSFPVLLGRYPMPLYPSGDRGRQRISSESAAKLPPIRPRPQVETISFCPMPLSSTDHSQICDPNILWTTMLNEQAGFLQGSQTPTDLSRPIMESTDSFESSAPKNAEQAFFYQDVWLGASTPKHQSIDNSESPNGILFSMPELENNDKERTPSSIGVVFDSQQSLMPFTGYL